MASTARAEDPTPPPKAPPAQPAPTQGSTVSAMAAVGFGSFVLGGASLGLSIGFAAKFFGDRDAAYDVCTTTPEGLVCPPSIERLHDTADADAAIAVTTLALGAAFVGLGATLVIVDATKTRAPATLAIVANPGGIALRGALP